MIILGSNYKAMIVGNEKFIIKYEILLEGASPLKNKEIKIDKCASSFHAQVRLEEYLKKKYSNFKQLIVHSCTKDYMSNLGDMGDIMNQFGDLFGGK